MSIPILETKNLKIGYRHKNQEKVVLENLNLQLNKGRLISLIGINGIGKSTLLRTLSGAQSALSGTIDLQQEAFNTYSKEDLSKEISVVFTEKINESHLKVRELVALGRIPYTNWIGTLTRKDWEIVDEAIELTEIKKLEDQAINSLSDGQMQKVLIARAIAQDTPIIILDEPSTHLDLYHKISLFRLLKKLCIEKDKSILFSTHDMDLALQISDEIIALTSDYTIQGATQDLINQNIFNNFFQDDHIVFEPAERRFKITLP